MAPILLSVALGSVLFASVAEADSTAEGGFVRVEKIVIRGNATTAERVIRNQLGFRPGNRITRLHLLEAERNLNRTELFGEPASVWFIPSETDASVGDVEVRVKETKTGSVMLICVLNPNPGQSGHVLITPPKPAR